MLRAEEERDGVEIEERRVSGTEDNRESDMDERRGVTCEKALKGSRRSWLVVEASCDGNWLFILSLLCDRVTGLVVVGTRTSVECLLLCVSDLGSGD